MYLNAAVFLEEPLCEHVSWGAVDMKFPGFLPVRASYCNYPCGYPGVQFRRMKRLDFLKNKRTYFITQRGL